MLDLKRIQSQQSVTDHDIDIEFNIYHNRTAVAGFDLWGCMTCNTVTKLECKSVPLLRLKAGCGGLEQSEP